MTTTNKPQKPIKVPIVRIHPGETKKIINIIRRPTTPKKGGS